MIFIFHNGFFTKLFLDSIKKHTQTPVFVGFGVNKITAKERARDADGVIAGSVFMEILLRENLSYTQKIAECSELAKILKNEINS